MTIDELKLLAENPNVSFIEAGANVNEPMPDISKEKVAEPLLTRWRFGSATDHRLGEGVLVGINDAQGFDFSHPDFLDENGKSRFIRIWDQGGITRPSPFRRDAKNYPDTFDYGSELTKEHLNALGKSPAFGLAAYNLEPQSQMDESSHGTHVVSIAAGNHGICSKAAIAGGGVSLAREDAIDRRRTFYDSTRLAHAVDYLIKLGDELGMPVVINISLGTNGHAHDGSSPLSRWIDSSLAIPGRSVCVAAGNAGQEVAEFEGDMTSGSGKIVGWGNPHSLSGRAAEHRENPAAIY